MFSRFFWTFNLKQTQEQCFLCPTALALPILTVWLGWWEKQSQTLDLQDYTPKTAGTELKTEWFLGSFSELSFLEACSGSFSQFLFVRGVGVYKAFQFKLPNRIKQWGMEVICFGDQGTPTRKPISNHRFKGFTNYWAGKYKICSWSSASKWLWHLISGTGCQQNDGVYVKKWMQCVLSLQE